MNWFRRFMAGRYGTDKLNITILGIALILCVTSLFLPFYTVKLVLTLISYFFMGFAIFGSGFLTALGDGLTSAVISFLRTLLFQVGAVLLLPLFFDVNGVWISSVVAEVMAVVFSFSFMLMKRKKFHY